MADRPKIPDDVLAFFKKQGAKGGKKRAKMYSAKQLSEWGKSGGRPKKKQRAKQKTRRKKL
jgi:hypothetical protein